jgi:DNA-binding winged helix-turn-helix (wHTH) protein/HEAT repeat protein
MDHPERVRIGFRFGPFLLDRETRELYRNGQLYKPLREQACKVLVRLLERAPTVVTREELVALVWGKGKEIEFGLANIIGDLRKDLGDSKDDPQYVQVLAGVGIRFVAAVEKVRPPQAIQIESHEGGIEFPTPAAKELSGIDEPEAKGLMVGYLKGLESDLAENHLLRRFGRTLDELRVPLRVTAYEPVRDIEEIRAREHFRQIGATEDHRSAATPASRAYAFRGTQSAQNAQSSLRSDPLLELEPALQTCVLLGDPGSGKTEWLKYRIRIAARQSRRNLEQSNPGLGDFCFPAYLRLPDIAAELKKEADLCRLLAETGCTPSVPSKLADADVACAAILSVLIQRRGLSKKLAPWVWRRLRVNPLPSGETPPLLCLDALDEVRVGQEILARFLNAFANSTDSHIFLTSRIIGYNHRPLPVENKNEGSRRELRVCPFEWQETETFVRDFFTSAPERGRSLLGELKTKLAISQMAQNPLLATLVCLAYSPSPNRPSLGFPTRRVDLYRQVIDGLLGDWETIDKRQILNRELVTSKIRLLEHPSFYFFPDEELTADRLHEFLWDEKNGYIRTLDTQDPLRQMLMRSTNGSLIQELSQDGVIVPIGGSGAASFMFLHLGFQEYFTACHFAKLINRDGWQKAGINDKDKGLVKTDRYVNCKVWLPAWHEVIILLAGKMTDPGPLLALLFDKSRDDHFRHRLAIAVACLTEVEPQTRHSPLANQIGITATIYWLSHAKKSTLPAISHLTRSMPVLVEVSDGQILEILGDALLSGRQDSRETSVEAIRALGSAAATPRFLTHLARLLSNSVMEIRHAAVEAIRGMGSAAATPEFLLSLSKLLEEGKPEVLRDCMNAVQAVGKQANTPEILACLTKLLQHHDEELRSSAASVLEMLRGAGVPAREKNLSTAEKEKMIKQMEEIFEDFNFEKEVAKSENAASQVMEELLEGFNFEDEDTKRENATSQVHADFLSATVRPEIVGRLARLLGDDPTIRPNDDRTESPGEPGHTARGDESEARDRRKELRHAALEVVATLGEAVATVDFLSFLAEILVHSNWELRRTAAGAVRRIGKKASTPVILDRIKGLLRDRNWEVKLAAVEAYGVIWNGIPDWIVLSRLAGLLGENDRTLRARVLGRISRYAVFRTAGQNRYDGMPPHWAAVAEFLDICAVREATSNVVRQMMASGIRIFKRGSIFTWWQARTVIELSNESR